ncbi:SNF2 family N-terminal domain-containing protein [Xylaria arbuscula]|nr:SNF2 family N-terminal domain-containing protein [Xylaria arbuscula]
MPGKRQKLQTEADAEAEAGSASKRVKHSHERLGLASLDGLSLDPSPLQDKQKIKTEHVVARDHPPSIRIIEPIDEDGEFPRRRTVIDLTRDTPSPESASPERDVSPVEAYDACFGMLCVKATCVQGASAPAECMPATVKFEGYVLRVFLHDSDERVAVVTSTAIFRLVTEFAVSLTATVCSKKQKVFDDEETSQPLSNSIFPVKFCSLRLTIYGFMQQKEQVADILSKANLFLQHPDPIEFDRSVKYVNPQYFLPPGAEMPEIEKLSINTCCSRRKTKQGSRGDSLGDSERNQILRIFNTAYESDGLMSIIKPSARLLTKLKRHQIEALVMMVEKEAGLYEKAHFPTIWKPVKSPSGQLRYQNIVTGIFRTSLPAPMNGGILADEMGLGKTLSSLSLICHSLDQMDEHLELSKILPRATLIVLPKSTIYAWEKQIATHIKPGKIRWTTYHGPNRQQVELNIDLYDVVLTTYDTLRSDQGKNKVLVGREWCRMILDEAHRIRNRSSQIFHLLCEMKAEYRWCLTGTPIQNSLNDFGALLKFIRVPPFENQSSFDIYILEPVEKRRKDAMKMLRGVVAATCLRRTKADNLSTLDLPVKDERIEWVDMGSDDRPLYEFFKRFSYLKVGAKDVTRRNANSNILVLISMLRLICDHGEALLPESALTAWKNRDQKMLSWEMLEANTGRCTACDRQLEDLKTEEAATANFKCGHIFCETCLVNEQDSASQQACLKCGTTALGSPPTRDSTSPSPPEVESRAAKKRNYPPSAKIKALLRNISEEQRTTGGVQPTKSVIFSCWVKMLNLIEASLKGRGVKVYRIDGQSSLSQRRKALETFGNEEEYSIMLASIGAAGEGIDLTAANNVHIVEPHWNPMAEAQAVDRIHRIGQTRDVKVIRYIISDSIEKYVHWVQRDKLRLIDETLSQSETNPDDVAGKRLLELLTYLE